MADQAVVERDLGGRFRTVRLLKEGRGVRTVLATDLTTKRPVVLKTTELTSVSPAAQMRLEHEAAVLSRINSESLAPLLHMGRDENLLYVAVPYVAGVTLAERLSLGPLDVREALTVVRGVLAGLGEAHQVGVLHRDVKPANIIVDSPGGATRAVLIDFGFARSARLDPSIRDLPVGTARYIAPEQAGMLDCDVDERSDLYSVGVVLFECLAGHPPFQAPSVGEVLSQHLTDHPPELRSLGVDVPRALDEIVQRLLRKDPRDRYQTTDAALADLNELMGALDAGIPDPPIVVGAHDRRRTLTEPAFVGREQVLHRLTEPLPAVLAGERHLACLEAPSGGGKTRLMEELAQSSARQGFRVFRGQGIDQAGRAPFQVLAGVMAGVRAAAQSDPALAEGMRTRVGDDIETVVDAQPALGTVLGPRSTAILGPEAHAETRTVRALGRLLSALGTPDKPALVLLDDCQWADEATLKLLEHWAATEQPDDTHVYVVAGYRSEEVGGDHPLRTMPGATRIALEPLRPEDIRALVESMAGVVPAEAADSVVELAEGSPFMAEAVLRGMVESGALVHDGHGWQADETAMVDVRSSRQAAAFLVRRVRLLPAPARRFLEVGAVLGKEFDLEMTSKLSGQDPPEAIGALDEARRRHLVWGRQHGSTCVFVHDKIRETLLANMDQEDVRRLHRAAALSLERSDSLRVYDLAYHFDAAGDPERALPYALDAGRRARSRHALETAEQQYQIASRASAGADAATRLEISEGFGDVLMLRGRYAEAAARLEEAATHATDDRSRAHLAAKLSELEFKRGALADSRLHAEEALRRVGRKVPRSGFGFVLGALWQVVIQITHTIVPGLVCGKRGLDGADDALLAVRLYSRLAHVYWFALGSVPTLWAHLSEMNLAEKYPPTAELAQAYSEHAPVMTLIPLWKRGVSYVQRSLRIRTDLEDVWGQGQSLNFYGIVLYCASRYEEALDVLRQSARLLERTGDHWELNIARIHTAFCLYRLGRLSDAVQEARRTHAAGIEIGDPQASGIGIEVWSKATEGEIPGRLVRTEMERTTADVQLAAEVLQAEAVRLLGRGRYGEAVTVLEDARRRVKAAGLRQEYVTGVWTWLLTALRHQLETTHAWDRDTRNRTLARARKVSREALIRCRFHRNELPHALREAAFLDAADGRVRRARRRLSRSLRIAEAHSDRYEAAKTLRARGELGRVLGFADATEAASRAEEMLSGMVPHVAVRRQEPVAASHEDSATLSLIDRFEALLDAGRQIATALSRAAIYSAVRESAHRLLRGERCVLISVKEGPEGSDLVAASGEIDASFSHSIARRSVEDGRTIVFADTDTSSSSESLELSGIRSALCSPIFVRGRAVGCFYVSHSQVGGLFGPDEERIASFIGTLAGAALENAEGFEDIQSLTRDLEQRVKSRTVELEESNLALDRSLRRLQQAYDREREAVRKLKEFDELKSDFLSTVSHELRTPLTSISGFAQTLEDHHDQLDTGTHKDFIRRIAANAEELDALISELLDFSRLERGKLRIDVQPFAVRQQTTAVLSKLSSMLGSHDVRVSIPDDVAALGDPSAFSRALENLLTNAAKFSDPGTQILVEGGFNEDEVEVRVADRGIGVPREEMERIFERFYRVSRGDHAATGGTGIGLAIVKEYIEAQGGRVSVEATEGGGTTFTIHLRAELGSTPGN